MSLKVLFRGYLHMCEVLDLYDFLYRQGEKGWSGELKAKR